MPNLSECLAKAGDLFPVDIRDSVVTRAIELRKGGASAEAAAKRAVQEALEAQEPARAELETAIKEGRELFEPAPAREEGEAQQPGTALERMAADNPDMMVRLPGMAENAPSMRLADALEQVKAEADEERFTGELVRVAADCALTFSS